MGTLLERINPLVVHEEVERPVPIAIAVVDLPLGLQEPEPGIVMNLRVVRADAQDQQPVFLGQTAADLLQPIELALAGPVIQGPESEKYILRMII